MARASTVEGSSPSSPFMIRSGLKRPAGHVYCARKVKPGIYVVQNAYEGSYEFFKTRPLPTAKFARVAQLDRVKFS